MKKILLPPIFLYLTGFFTWCIISSVFAAEPLEKPAGNIEKDFGLFVNDLLTKNRNDLHTVTFSVTDEYYNPLSGAKIVISPESGKKLHRPISIPNKKFLLKEQHADNPPVQGDLGVAPITRPGPMPVNKSDKSEGHWINYFTDVNELALGLAMEATWYNAIRWMPEDLIPYEGWAVSKIRIFINDLPNGGNAKIWQGNMSDPVVMVSQPMTVAQEAWVEVELSYPYLIDTSQELWIGWAIDDPGVNVFPAAFDITSEFTPFSDLLQYGDNPWQNASIYGFDLAWNIEAFVEPYDSDIMILFTDNNGQAWFDATNGNYSYTITKDAYMPASGMFTVAGSDLAIDVNLNTDIGLREVTFNVNMETAVGFNPDLHNVYLTGTFTGWAEPGMEGSIEMLPASGSEKYQTIFFEAFEDGQVPEGWLNIDANNDGHEWFIVTIYHNPYVGNYAIASASWDWNSGSILYPDNWLITPQILNVQTDYELSFYIKAQDPSWAEEKYDVLISTTGTDLSDFTSVWSETLVDGDWHLRTIGLGNYLGQDIYIAFRHWDVFDMFQIVLDAIKVEGTPADSNEFLYTAVVEEVEMGLQEYKYFSNAFGEGWYGGEWQGDPNRSVLVESDMVVDDIWGVYEENGLFSFIHPLPGQTYEVGVDEVIPVQVQMQSNYSGVYWLYINIDGYWDYFESAYFEGPGVFNHQYNISDALPSGYHNFILEYYIYEFGGWSYIESNTFQIINNMPGIDVRSPASGQAWITGNYYDIRWNSNNVSMVNIHYSTDNGNSWELIAANVTSNDGYYYWGNNYFYWEVPEDINGIFNQSLIRIEDVVNPSTVGYSETFTLMSSPLIFNAPLAGQVFEVGVDEVIPVEIEMTGNYSVEYALYLVNGIWDFLGYDYFYGPGVHSFDYQIPVTMGPGDYQFLLYFYFDQLDVWGYILSDSFTIINNLSAIEVCQPQGGEAWVAGTFNDIRWNSANVSSVNIHYSLDNGENWNLVAASVPSSNGYYYYGYNLYYWQVPDDISGIHEQSLIRIQKADDTDTYGFSEWFTILGNPVNFIHPTSETVLAAGQELQIELEVFLSSWIGLELVDENYNWYWIGDEFADAGILYYTFSDTQWLTPGNYRVSAYHYYTGQQVFSDYFQVVPAGTQFDATFHVDMSAVPGFDSSEHKVFLTGTFTGWAVPGTAGSIEMDLTDTKSLIYTAALQLEPGHTEYKYYSDAFGQGWNGGEWDGGPNRIIQVSGDMEIHDQWGVHPQVFFHLMLHTNPEDAGTLSGAGYYNAGQEVWLEAIAAGGFVFTDWTDGYGNMVSTEPGFEYTMLPRHHSLTANFETLQLFTLTLEAVPEEGGMVSGGGQFPAGQQITILATPNEGFTFLSWINEAQEEVTQESEFEFVMPDMDVTLTAIFASDYTHIADPEAGSIYLFPNPASNELNIQAGRVIERVLLYSITGKLVFSKDVGSTNTKLSVQGFETGLYFIRIITENQVVTQKVIIQN